jgi:hypothetical protein
MIALEIAFLLGFSSIFVDTCVCLCDTSPMLKRYAVFLRKSQIDQLQKLFKKTGVRPAEFIRRALDVALDAQNVKGKRS